MNIGPTEVLLVLVILLLLFGASRLPRLARSIGQASAELRAGQKDVHRSEGVAGNGHPDSAAADRQVDLPPSSAKADEPG